MLSYKIEEQDEIDFGKKRLKTKWSPYEKNIS